MWFLKAADSAVQKFYSVKKNPDQIEIFRDEEIFPLKTRAASLYRVDSICHERFYQITQTNLMEFLF